MLRVWGRLSSFNVQKVLWLADELAVAYEHVPAGGDFGRLDEPEFGKLNPHRRVPVIEDGKTVVWESHAILRYLAARYGCGRFWSDEPAERVRVDGWMDWAQTALQPAFLNGVFWGFFRTPEAQRDWPSIRRSLERTNQCYRILDRTLEKRLFMLGDDLSLADIPIGTSLYRYFELEIERPSLPNIEIYYQRLGQRPAYRTNVMRPFEELRNRLEY